MTGYLQRRPAQIIGVGVGIDRARNIARRAAVSAGATRRHAMRRLMCRRSVGKADRAVAMRTRIIALLARWQDASRLGRILARVHDRSVVFTTQTRVDADARQPDSKLDTAIGLPREVPTSSGRAKLASGGSR